MINFLYIIPEIIIMTVLSFVIVLDSFFSKNNKKISYYFVQLSLFLCSYYIIDNFNFLNKNTSNLYNTSIFSNIFKLFITLSLALILHYTYKFLQYFKKYESEYFMIALFALIGMMIMVSSEHLLFLYLGIELLSLSLYSLISFNRDSIFSSEAAIKYYILGAIASGFLLFGISLIYGLTGSLYYVEISNQISSLNFSSSEYTLHAVGLIFALTFILISLAFKFGAAPFHMWIPDVYHGSLITTTLLLSTVPKIAIFIIIIKIINSIFSNLYIFWADILFILSILSIIVGNVTAIVQTNIKRMLAYSTIANIGFILLGIFTGSIEGYKAAMFYTITYVLFTIAAFGLLSELKNGESPIEEITNLSGLNKQYPILAFIFMLLMLSFIGIPPLLGFHAKLFIIQSLIFTSNIFLSIFAVLMTVIGSYYYLRVIKVMYFDNLDNKLSCISTSYITYLYVFLLVLLGLFPDILGQISYYSISNL